jgi:HAD superfamily hydrolase (TIGR01509 family)
VDAVLLDMDGTLVDSDASVERAWRAWADQEGVPMELLLPRLHGSPAGITIRALQPQYDDDAIDRATQFQLGLQYDDLADLRALPGAHELLATLDKFGLPWAVVTSADRKLAKARLGAVGIEPPVLVTIEDTARGKPFPDPYLLAAERLGVDPRRCLVVEDSQPGIDAGHAAGAQVAALRGLKAELSIASLTELSDRLPAGLVFSDGS